MGEFRCEAEVDVDDDGLSIVTCGRPAQLRQNLMLFEVSLCDECYQRIKEKREADMTHR